MSHFDFQLYSKPYVHEKFVQVYVGFLTKFEGSSAEVAGYAAEKCWDAGMRDVTKVRGIIRMLRELTFEEVDRLVKFQVKYRR